MAYDNKFRKRVIDNIMSGRTHDETSKTFKIGTTTIKRWVKEYKETGLIGSGYTVANRKAKKIDPEKLETYMNEYPDAFLREIAAHFSCCLESVRKALKRIGYTLKKNERV